MKQHLQACGIATHKLALKPVPPEPAAPASAVAAHRHARRPGMCMHAASVHAPGSALTADKLGVCRVQRERKDGVGVGICDRMSRHQLQLPRLWGRNWSAVGLCGGIVRLSGPATAVTAAQFHSRSHSDRGKRVPARNSTPAASRQPHQPPQHPSHQPPATTATPAGAQQALPGSLQARRQRPPPRCCSTPWWC